MGSAASKLTRPSKISSGDDLLAKTKDVREMSNALFQFMYGQWPDDEYMDMARDPGAYVVAISDLITEQFHVIGYTTKRNQIGEIYFIKHDKLKHPGSEGQAGIEQQRQNTQIIAFYFVRLFQILGSLLLVVKDISFPIEKPIDTMITGRPIINQAQAPLARFRGVNQSGGANQIGGSDNILFNKNIPLGNYEFLRYYLRDLSRNQELITKYKNEYGFPIDPNTTFMLKDSANLFFKYTAIQAGANRRAKAEFYMIITRPQYNRPEYKNQVVSVTNINTRGNDLPSKYTDAISQLDQYPITLTLNLETSRTPLQATLNRTDSRAIKDSYSSGAEYYFISGNEMIDTFIGLYADKPKIQFVKILEQIVLQAIRKANNDGTIRMYPIAKEETNVAAGPKVIERGKLADDNMDKRTTIKEVYKLLLNTEKGIMKSKENLHNPHCISRALQLLDAKSIQESMPRNPKTRICKVAVADKSGDISLAKYIPTKTLAQLYGKVDRNEFEKCKFIIKAFVDIKDGGVPSTEPVSTEDLNQYGQKDESSALSSALTRLSAAFNFVSEKPLTSFNDITLSRPKECYGRTDVLDVKNTQVINKLQSTAQQLMAYHINHTIEISKFLMTIFNISHRPDGSWKVEGPKTEILFAGFQVLDQLTNQARELLVDYYSGCETLYQMGLKSWTDFEAEEKKAKNANAGVPNPVPGNPLPGNPLPGNPLPGNPLAPNPLPPNPLPPVPNNRITSGNLR
jgi:hypothetical protein